MSSPIKVFILGSCVSRDPFEFADELDFDLVAYYARFSFASLAAEPYVDEEILKGIKSNFQRRVARADMDKSVFSAIKSACYDLLLVDLVDERFPLSIFENSIHTLSSGYRQGLYRPNSYGFVRGGSKKRRTLWRKGIEKISDFLISNELDGKLVVNRVYWSTNCEHPEELLSHFTQESIDDANRELEWMYNEIEKSIPCVRFINYSRNELVVDLNHKWGLSPFHYTKVAGDRLLSQLHSLSLSSN